MEDSCQRYMVNKCLYGSQIGPQKVVVRQVIGQNTKQKAIDLHMCVPQRKPAIEQIIDVFVKKVKITHVEVITDKVIVRGHFEVKAIYVACLPHQPVHAVEMRRVRFTVDIPIYGARCGMDAEASVAVEFVDYDCYDRSRLYKHKYGKHHYDCDDGHHYHHHDCDDDYHHHGHDYDCDHHHVHDCGQCKPHYCPPCDDKCTREFDVSVILRITAKVMTDREILIGNSYYPGLPAKPKG